MYVKYDLTIKYLSLGMNFMHRSPEYTVAFGKADHLPHGATTPLYVSVSFSPCLSVSLFRFDDSLVDMSA